MEGDERSPAAQRGTRSRRHAVHGAASRALSSAYRQGNFHLHTGREIFLSLRNRKTMAESAMNKEFF